MQTPILYRVSSRARKKLLKVIYHVWKEIVPMDKEQVAAILNEIGTLLALQGENSFRCNAYHNAARAIEQLSGNLADIVAAGTLGDIPGIGTTLQEKITTLVTTGRLPYYDDLRQKIPAGMLQMLRIPGMGPKKVKAVHDELGIDDLEKLKAACARGEVAVLKGFGAKTQQKILEGIAFIAQVSDRVRIDQALPLALAIMERLRKFPGVKRMEMCGSLRRRKEVIRDIDILVSSDKAGPIMDAFVKSPGVINVVGHGETKSSVVLEAGSGDGRIVINADLRVVSDEEFPFALNYFTGSKEHNVAMRGRAQQYGLKLNEYELVGKNRRVPCRDEADIYRALDLDYVEPEMREQTGELEAAAAHRLPALVTTDAIRGVFHCHTTWSDGAASLEEMAQAARKLGLKYLGIADHSQSLTVARGLTPDRVRKQHAEIDALNARLKEIKLLKGTECDILADGRLDFDDKVLASFDYVVASVHSLFNQTEAEMTARIVKAVSHPRVTMLGHATGRLLLRRDGYKVDLEAVLQAAARHGTMIEINAQPQRLDLDWIHCKRARDLGIPLVINPDAHSTTEIGYYPYGVDVARRGWLEERDVFNTRSLKDVIKELERRRQ
jgi:DNA polymerase (family 10)